MSGFSNVDAWDFVYDYHLTMTFHERLVNGGSVPGCCTVV